MSYKVEGKDVISGVSWRLAERIGAQGVSTVVSVLLARLLLPEEYGVVTMVLVFINIANVLVTSGLGQSLVQDKDAGDLEFSTMTYVSLAASAIFYFILFFCAPMLAGYYKMPLLSPVLRVLSLKLILAGYNTIQQAYVQKNMMFKKFFFSTLGGTVISGVVGVLMAYQGFGVWALVAQYLINSTVDTIVLFFSIGWKPKRMFSVDRAKKLFSFSWKLTIGDLAGAIYNELRSLIIGRYYTGSDLAFYNKGFQFPQLVIGNIDASVASVLYPTMVSVNGTAEGLKEVARKTIRVSSFFLFPALVGLSVVAEPFVEVILTRRWIPCVPYLQIACYSYITVPLSSANLQAIKALGRSDLVMRLEIFKKAIGLAFICMAARWGVIAIALSGVFYSVVAVIANAVPVRKLINYTYKEQIADLMPFAAMSGIMGILVHLLKYAGMSTGFLLTAQVICGIVIYFGLAYALRNDVMMRVLYMIEDKKMKYIGGENNDGDS